MRGPAFARLPVSLKLAGQNVRPWFSILEYVVTKNEQVILNVGAASSENLSNSIAKAKFFCADTLLDFDERLS